MEKGRPKKKKKKSFYFYLKMLINETRDTVFLPLFLFLFLSRQEKPEEDSWPLGKDVRMAYF